MSVVPFQVKKVDETLKKIKSEFQNRPQKKASEFTTKVQLKKLVDEMEKEIGPLLTANKHSKCLN